MENSGTSCMVINPTWKKDNRITSFYFGHYQFYRKKKDGIKDCRQTTIVRRTRRIFFDVCMNLLSSVLLYDFIHKMSEKYQEIENELEYLLGDYYTKTLSSGIKRSLFKK